MTKNEFLNNLRISISSLGEPLISNKIDYYSQYIDDELNKGKNLDDVLDELGDPNLIGKTIVDVEKNTSNLDNNETKNFDDTKNDKTNFNNIFKFNTNSTLGCAIIFLILFIIITYILRILGYAILGTVAFTGGPMGLILFIIIIYYLFFRQRY